MLVSKALDKKVHGLGSKHVNLGDIVRYGVSGFTVSQIKELL